MFSDEELAAKNFTPEMIARYKTKFAHRLDVKKEPAAAVPSLPAPVESFEEWVERRHAAQSEIEKRLDAYNNALGKLLYEAAPEVLDLWNAEGEKTAELADSVLLMLDQAEEFGVVELEGYEQLSIEEVLAFVANLEPVPRAATDASPSSQGCV